jgi:hypothetical protein
MVNLATEHGPWVQPRFSRVTYRELKRAAKQDGLAITAWIRRNCEAALA